MGGRQCGHKPQGYVALRPPEAFLVALQLQKPSRRPRQKTKTLGGSLEESTKISRDYCGIHLEDKID